MARRILVALALMALAVSSPLAQSVRKENDELALGKARREFVAAMNARDPDRVVACLAPGVVFLAENQKALEGREAFRELFQRMLASGQTWELTMETTHLESSGGLAYELGRYSIVRRLPDGSTKNPRGKYVDVWKRRPDGAWQIVVHAPSDDPKE